MAISPKTYHVENNKTELAWGCEKPPLNTMMQVFESSLVKRIKDWIKMVNFSTYWISAALPTAPDGLTQLGLRCREFNSFLAFRELHGKVANLFSSTTDVVTKGLARSVKPVFLDSASLVNSVSDVVEFISGFVSLNHVFKERVAAANAFALLGSKSVGALKEWDKFDKATKDCHVEMQILSLLKLAKNVSYVAYGAFTVFCLAAGVPVSVPFILTCLTAATVFSLSSYFYEQLYDPEQKNSNIALSTLAPRLQFIV